MQRACRVVAISRAAYYRNPQDRALRDAPVVDALNAVVAKHGRWGFWKCHDRLKLDGHAWNHKRTWRVYCAMKLNLPRRTKKRLVRTFQSLDAPALPNQIWSLDFMSDSLYQGRRFRTLNVLDEAVREALTIEVDRRCCINGDRKHEPLSGAEFRRYGRISGVRAWPCG